MSTPAQPAPVTPPPEWAVKAVQEMFEQGIDFKVPLSARHVSKGMAAAIIQRHAPPPAPSCTTEQGFWAALVERLEGVKGFIKRVEDATGDEFMWYNYTQSYCALDDAIAALSRQPAPAGDASGQSGEGVELPRTDEVKDADIIADLRAQLNATAKDRNSWKTLAVQAEAQLRAAPAAVAKDRADQLREKLDDLARLEACDPYGSSWENRFTTQWVRGLVSLLSQPAVAQTEAGNKDSARLDWIDEDVSRFDGIFAQFVGLEGLSVREAIDRAAGPALSESSPKSPSVPAVAGGGEDAARWRLVEPMVRRMDECITMANRNGDLISLADIAVEHRDEIKEACADVIDAAIAATKAKEGV